MGFINDYVAGKVRIGKIDILDNFSFFEVPENIALQTIKSFKGLYVDDRKLVVEVAQNSNNKNQMRARQSKKRRSKRRAY